MAVDRYLAVVSHNLVPKKLKQLRKDPKFVVLLCSLTWFLSVVAIIPVFRRTIFKQTVSNGTITSSQCYIDWSKTGKMECKPIKNDSSSNFNDDSSSLNDLNIGSSDFHECGCKSTQPYSDFIICLFVFGYFLPIVCFLLSYGSLLCKIVKSQKKLVGHSKTNFVGNTNRGINRRSVYMISSLMLGLVVCYTPFHIYHIMRVWNIRLSRSHCDRFKTTVDALIWLLPAINPLFYSFFASEFQTRFKLISSSTRRYFENMKKQRSFAKTNHQACLDVRAIDEDQTSNLSWDN